MANGSKKPDVKQEQRKQQLPPWAEPIVRVCAAIYPYMLSLAALAFVMVMALIAVKRLDLAWIPNVAGAVLFFAFIGILAMLIAEYESPAPAWITTVLGIGLYYAPLWLALLATKIALPETQMPSLNTLAKTFSNLGVFTVIISVISLMAAYVRYFMQRESSLRQSRMQFLMETAATNVEKPSLVPKCWQMSRCRPSVRGTCPNYLDQTPCWKRRSGCFCDRELANLLITSVGRGEAQEILDIQHNAQAQAISRVRGHQANKAHRPSWSQQKRRCHSCPLYNEHQEYKYKHFNWAGIFITIAVVAGGYPFYHMAYEKSVGYLDEAIKHFPQIPGTTTSTLINSPFEYLLLGVLSLLLFTYIIALVDKFFLEWKL